MVKIETLSPTQAIQEIKPLLQANKLAIFVGSGISVPAPSNLPTWDDLINSFVDFCEELSEFYPEIFSHEILNDAKGSLSQYPIQVVTALKGRIEGAESSQIKTEFRRWLMRKFDTVNYNDLHRTIVETNYMQVVTTNYDTLIEDAARKLKYGSLALKQLDYTKVDKVASAIYEETPSVIHIHGIWDRINSDEIVFTNDDYQKVMRDYSGFRCAVQSLFLRYSLLIVGYGCSDPHFEDFMEELNHNLKWRNTANTPQYYLVLKKDKVNSIISHYHYRLSSKIVVIEEYGDLLHFLKELKKIKPRKKES